MIKNGTTDGNSTPARPRPLSPNIQIYRPQLTSVLSIANRITGIFLSLGAVGLVVWLSAAAAGAQTYGVVHSAIGSWAGQVVLFGCTFAFFLHLCGGIRHLVWDTVHGFELRSIYISGWTVVGSSVALTAAAWVVSLFVAGGPNELPILPLAAGSRPWTRLGKKWLPALVGGARLGGCACSSMPMVRRINYRSCRERLCGLHRLDEDTTCHELHDPHADRAISSLCAWSAGGD